MTSWSPQIEESGPVYLAITRALETDLARGRVAVGDRLPTHRDLASSLGVNVGTVSRAYAEARRRGLIRGEVGRGTFVSEPGASGLSQIQVDGSPHPIDLGINLPLSEPAPDLIQAFETLARRSELTRVMAYQDPLGSMRARESGVAWFARWGLDFGPDRLATCAGAQHAILVALAAHAAPGDLVVCESLTYPGFLGAARLLGLRVRGIDIDAEGLDPDALEEVCREERPRLLYCMPSLHNPTSAQLSSRRRQQVAEIAERHDLVIVQDEIQAGLVDDSNDSLANLVPEQVISIVSLSKTLSPGLRIAFLGAPEARMPRIKEALWSSIWMTSPLCAELASVWIEDGTADRILIERRAEMARRHAVAADLFAGIPHQTRAGSYQIWIPLDPPWDSRSMCDVLAREGVRVSGAHEFQTSPGTAPEAIRVSLSGPRHIEELAQALEIVARCCADAPPGATPLL